MNAQKIKMVFHNENHSWLTVLNAAADEAGERQQMWREG